MPYNIAHTHRGLRLAHLCNVGFSGAMGQFWKMSSPRLPMTYIDGGSEVS